MRPRYVALAVVVLFGATAAVVWGPHLSGEFFWDDAAYLRDNLRLAPGALGVSSASGFSTDSSFQWLVRAYATLLLHHGAAFATFRDAPSAMRRILRARRIGGRGVRTARVGSSRENPRWRALGHRVRGARDAVIPPRRRVARRVGRQDDARAALAVAARLAAARAQQNR